MAERSWRTRLAGHRRTRLVLGKGTGIGRLWTSWKSRRLRNSWAGLSGLAAYLIPMSSLLALQHPYGS